MVIEFVCAAVLQGFVMGERCDNRDEAVTKV
jgi:hypothetical protein